MRQLIENPVYMTYKEMETTFNNKWIYIVKCNMADGNELVGGYPIVVADTPFEGDVAFYEQFRTNEFTPRCSRDFNVNEQLFFPTFPPDEVFQCLVPN